MGRLFQGFLGYKLDSFNDLCINVQDSAKVANHQVMGKTGGIQQEGVRKTDSSITGWITTNLKHRKKISLKDKEKRVPPLG